VYKVFRQYGMHADGVTLPQGEGIPDALLITDAAPLTEYILSGRIELTADRQADLAKFVRQELLANGGKFYITKESGLFEASGS
jgi:hypothetical protein